MKKIFVFALVLVSVAFFFGCSADGIFISDKEPPTWEGEPSSTNPSTGPGGGGEQYCSFYEISERENMCEKLDGQLTEDICKGILNGTVVNSCP
jgi:hypothetical protein